MRAGTFIAFEGLDGSGQSTQIQLLADYLEKKGLRVLRTKEPTQATEAGREIVAVLTHQKTTDPAALQRFFAEDRRAHVEQVILPAVQEGTVVLSDRYKYSSLAFGSIDCEARYLAELNAGFPEPDLVILLRVRPAVSLERILKRGKPTELFEKEEKLRKVAAAYDALSAASPRWLVVDGERGIEAVHSDIVAQVDKII